MPERKHPGYLITFEGTEGCGKSTIAREITRWLYVEHGIWPPEFREPGGTAIGEVIRDLLQDSQNPEMDYRTEMFLFQAARAEITEKKIIPALEGGRIVLLDRFRDSTCAYQGIARGLGRELVDYLNEISTQGLMPDLTLLLDLPAEVGLERRRNSGKLTRIEKEDLSFHQKVREAYLDMYKEDNTSRWVLVNANQELKEVIKEATTAVEGRLVSANLIERPKFGVER